LFCGFHIKSEAQLPDLLGGFCLALPNALPYASHHCVQPHCEEIHRCFGPGSRQLCPSVRTDRSIARLGLSQPGNGMVPPVMETQTRKGTARFADILPPQFSLAHVFAGAWSSPHRDN
jgi:hypothetical protein